MNDGAVVFHSRGEELVGVVTAPALPAVRGVLILGGGPQYRIGSHRQFVHLARSLAGRGIASMRFDYNGIGDAGGALRWTFEDLEADIGAALDAMQREVPTLRHVALWGLCGGASAALLYWRATQDARVAAMVLVNPWLRTAATLARTHVKHYYLKRLGQRDFWQKLLGGQLVWSALTGLLRDLRLAAKAGAAGQGAAGSPSLGQRMCSGWMSFRGPILLVLSQQDYTAKEFLEAVALDKVWRKLLALPRVTRLDLEDADHTFSRSEDQAAVERATWELARSMGKNGDARRAPVAGSVAGSPPAGLATAPGGADGGHVDR